MNSKWNYLGNELSVSFNNTLIERTISFCKDELDYHINGNCPYEYFDEICAEIELLYRLGKERIARIYKNQFIKAMNKIIKEEPDLDLRRELRGWKDEFILMFWNPLVEENPTIEEA